MMYSYRLLTAARTPLFVDGASAAGFTDALSDGTSSGAAAPAVSAATGGATDVVLRLEKERAN